VVAKAISAMSVGKFMNIDRKRVAAVAALEAQGWVSRDGAWVSPSEGGLPMTRLVRIADEHYKLAARRADGLARSVADSAELAEQELLDFVIKAYKADRGPLHKEQGSKS
jgi:hypothetical protein